MQKRTGFCVFACSILLAFAFTASAQVTGRLTGRIMDPQGAAVPSATVGVIIPGGTAAIFNTTTNTEGLFYISGVPANTYSVEVEAKGFAKYKLTSVKVAPIQETNLPPITLTVQGSVAVIEVAATPDAVQLANAEIATTITSEQVSNLPVVGRQISRLFNTQPGVSSGTNSTTVNGLRASFVNLTLDGINIQDNFTRTNDLDYAPMRTTIDQISEITITTSNSDLTSGGGSAQIVLTTKSGGNAYHGSAYWFDRRSKLASNDWFNNKSGTAIPYLALKQPGVAVGGPIKKDKLFFYANFELYRLNAQDSRLRTTLTDNARNGIFTYRDSTSTVRTLNLASIRTFTADPTIKAMIASLPAANTTDAGDGLNTSGYRFNARANEFRDQFITKGDYYVSPRNHVFATYNYIKNPTDRPDQGTFYTKVPPVRNELKNHLLSLNWRSNASATFTNQVGGGFLKADTAFLVSNDYPKTLLAGLLFSNPVNTFLNQGRNTGTYEIFDNATWIKNKHTFSFGFQSHSIRVNPFNDGGIVPTATLGISAANTTGITAGEIPGGSAANATTANTLYTNLAGIVTQMAQTFNVTSTTSGFVPGATNLRQFSYDTYSFHVSDSWKVKRNLTFQLGLRYEYWLPLDEKNSLYLAPKLVNNDLRATLLDPNAVLDFIGKSSGRPFYKTDKNNFAPNLGFAWSPGSNGTTSIRGGYKISFVNDNLVSAVRNNVATSQGLQFGNTLTGLTNTLPNIPTVTAPVYKVPRTLADNFALVATSATGLPDPNMRTPYVQEFNLSIEQQFKNTFFAIRYVGNKGSKLLRAFDYNQVNFNASGFFADFQRAQKNGELARAANGIFVAAYNPNIVGSQPLTIFPTLGNAGNLTNATVLPLLQQGEVASLADYYFTNRLAGPVSFYTNPNIQGGNTISNAGWSNYNSLQMEVRRHTRSGLEYQLSYVFSKALGNATGDIQTNFEPLLDNANPSLEVSRSPWDINHVFKANYYYQLPFGAGKKWSGNRITNAVFGGWAVSSIWSYQSGSPISLISGRGTFNRAGRSAATNTASSSLTNAQLKAMTGQTFMTGTGPYFFDPSAIGIDGRGAASAGSSAFASQVLFNPVAGTVGNLQRRAFSGPWQWSFDSSVQKSIKLSEAKSLDLRFEFFNILNHPTFFVAPSTAGDFGSVAAVDINGTGFGKMTSMNYASRRIQLGAYYRF